MNSATAMKHYLLYFSTNSVSKYKRTKCQDVAILLQDTTQTCPFNSFSLARHMTTQTSVPVDICQSGHFSTVHLSTRISVKVD